MKFPLYQYSKELKCWVWLSSVQITGKVEQYMFPEGCFAFSFWFCSLRKTPIEKNFMDNVKTIQIPLA